MFLNRLVGWVVGETMRVAVNMGEGLNRDDTYIAMTHPGLRYKRFSITTYYG